MAQLPEITTAHLEVLRAMQGYVAENLNFLGAVAGIDIRRPAIKLPALGRFGVAAFP